MHVLLENVRSEIEYLSGKESYLSCSVFWRIHNEIGYEKDGEEPLSTKEAFNEVATQAINCLAFPEKWDLRTEILSWKTGMLRDLGRYFYHNWEKLLRDRFLCAAKFKDGKPCLALEAYCEETGVDPTGLYVTLVDLLTVATRLATACNTVVLELEKIIEFEQNILSKDPSNAFLKKRLQNETNNAILTQCLKKLEAAATVCDKNSKYVKSNFFVVWSLAYEEITAIVTSLKTFFAYRKVKEFEYELAKWISDMFPERFLDGRRNLLNESQLHHEILNKLACATNALYLYVAKNDQTVFFKRDQLIHSQLHSIFKKHIQAELDKRQYEDIVPLTEKYLQATSD